MNKHPFNPTNTLHPRNTLYPLITPLFHPPITLFFPLNSLLRVSMQNNAWAWTTEETAIKSTRIAFPEYGVFRQLENDDDLSANAAGGPPRTCC